MKNLTKTNKEVLEYPKSVLADVLPDLFFWEGAEFGDWTISELTNLILRTLEANETEKSQ